MKHPLSPTLGKNAKKAVYSPITSDRVRTLVANSPVNNETTNAI